MSALAGLGPLLDLPALWGIAKQLWSARERLHLRTGHNMPTASQLAVGLRMYIVDQDKKRSAEAAAAVTANARWSSDGSDGSGGSFEPNIAAAPSSSEKELALELRYYLALAEAAYADSTDHLLEQVAMLKEQDEEERSYASGVQVVDARLCASKYHPAYFVCYDARLDAVVLSCRGSKEVADHLTNLSCETEPFLDGYGHAGIVRSTQNLVGVVIDSVYALLDAHTPRNGLVVIGHSLGGAIASLITAMLHSNSVETYRLLAEQTPTPSVAAASSSSQASQPVPMRTRLRLRSSAVPNVTVGKPSKYALLVASRAKCVAFGSPPCLSADVARRVAGFDITTVVLGLDMVPRLSAASLDRLLLAVSRYDWAEETSRSVESRVTDLAAPIVGAATAATAASLLVQHGPSGLAWAAGAIGASARRALSSVPPSPPHAAAARGSSAAGMISGTTSISPVWKIALTVTAVASTFLTNQFLSPEPVHAGTRADGNSDALRQPDYSFARQFGMSADDVERALLPEQPENFFLAGKILHVDRPFTTPGSFSGDEASLPTVRIIQRDATEFSDVEASAFMLHDHRPQNLILAFTGILDVRTADSFENV
jgi:pimeloyl-ACP methyl ester carboxylesterase